MPATPLLLLVTAAMVPATCVPCQEELLRLASRCRTRRRVAPVALVGRVAVAAVAVAGDGGVGDEVVARDDVRGEVGVRDVAGVDDGDGHAGAGGLVPGARARSCRRWPRRGPTAWCTRCRSGSASGVHQAVRLDVGDLRVGRNSAMTSATSALVTVLAEVDEGRAAAEAALEVEALAGLLALGRGVGVGGRVRAWPRRRRTCSRRSGARPVVPGAASVAPATAGAASALADGAWATATEEVRPATRATETAAADMSFRPAVRESGGTQGLAFRGLLMSGEERQ